MPGLRHVVLMGDPTHFSVVGGANPHTRSRWGRKKSVDRATAIAQWRRMADTLRNLGLEVAVIPADPAHPGLVYPANAGFRWGNHFVLSNLTPTRAGEKAHYRAALEAFDELEVVEIGARFEGEADLFPAGEHYLFTHGTIEKQRFVFRPGWPPYRRVYGFRSQLSAIDEINAIAPLPRKVLPVALRDERYYHGDTCLCSFGADREFLIAYLDVLAPESAAELRRAFGDRLLPIEGTDAAIYAANSFAFTRNGTPHLVMPEGVSARLRDTIRDRGTTSITVDVTEFYKKGGGSVKCMIGDLGEIE